MREDPKLVRMLGLAPERSESDLKLDDGSRVGVIGGGSAGSYFTYLLLSMAEMMGMDLHVDVYEPREFNKPGPGGCNQRCGIVSESLVQILATEGINLPADAYRRHSPQSSPQGNYGLKVEKLR